ncbi:hypothetical protein TNCV_3403151 [Trichonephila clavipes]|nr:hypothetical protein TNCV_3403151 [Trichonephila clavipes]
MIATSPLSPDEYAMRIATQTESALICKEYSSPFIVSQFRCFRHHRERLLRWAGVKGTHRTGRRLAKTYRSPPVQRSSPAVCHCFWPKTRYVVRSNIQIAVPVCRRVNNVVNSTVKHVLMVRHWSPFSMIRSRYTLRLKVTPKPIIDVV